MPPREKAWIKNKTSNNYGSIGVDDSSVPPVQPDDREHEGKLAATSGHDSRNKKKLIALLVGVVAVACFVVFVHPTRNNDHAVVDEDSKNAIGTNNNKADELTTKVLNWIASVSPEDDRFGFEGVDRGEGADPSLIWGQVMGPYPTNSWYLNLVSHKASVQPDDGSRVYTVPYIIDTAANAVGMAGIRVHWPVVQANSRNVQMVDDYKNGLTLGVVTDQGSGNNNNKYVVDEEEVLSPLGVSLKWNWDNDATTTTASDGDDTFNENKMTTHIVRGMPYATMRYYGSTVLPSLFSYNALASPILIDNGDDPTTALKCGVMGANNDKRGHADNAVTVQKELQLHFINSDFTWALFFSHPVRVRCEQSEGDINLAEFKLHVVAIAKKKHHRHRDSGGTDPPLTVRLALLDQCTTGKADVQQHCLEKTEWKNQNGYVDLLRERAHIFPSSPQVKFDYSDDDETNGTNTTNTTTMTTTTSTKHFQMTIDWKARRTTSSPAATSATTSGRLLRRQQQRPEREADDPPLLMFALPHHYQSHANSELGEASDSQEAWNITEHCVPTFHGKTCLVEGNKWFLTEDVVARTSNDDDTSSSKMLFAASRPPEASAIPALANALTQDIHYRLSDNTLRGAGDTYFSGKVLAHLGRIIMIATELRQLASASTASADNEKEGKGDLKILLRLYKDDTLTEKEMGEIVEAAAAASLPSADDITNAVDMLRRGVQIWLDPTRPEAAPYVYDRTWGGFVNCGCDYSTQDEFGHCTNDFPNCPALDDVNQDFGNGFYNDHHYHYGYHVYAAAVVALHDKEWGRKWFERILFYIRDFANPWENDEYFPQFRQKDWYLGSSWASGIVSAETSPHGRDQESSSEAIAAYEAVGLFGAVMVDAFAGENDNNDKDGKNLHQVAERVRDAGQLLVSTELRATKRYWHVWLHTRSDGTTDEEHYHAYPKAYDKPVVGMLYDTMASFQTWFAPWAVVSYGIQLMPLTPIADYRDDPEWAKELYPLYKASCEEAGDFCIDNGWSILQASLLATSGNRSEALEQALEIPSEVFASEGGMGNSLSNTIWYIATRKPVDDTSR